MTTMTIPEFAVVPGVDIHRTLNTSQRAVIDVVEHAYRLHGAGQTVNPPSYFLRFPDRPQSRIIALPASVGGDVGVDGIKWISSFPGNIAGGLPRASAVMILNDQATGYPIACLEGSIISAARTAASATLAAGRLYGDRPRPTRLGIVGAGLIARYIHSYLIADGWQFSEVAVHDLDPAQAAGLGRHLERADPQAPVTVPVDQETLVRGSDLIVYATVAAEPHVHEPAWFAHNPLVLHVSLRDLAPAVILSAANVVDDVEHVLKAGTSVHLTEQQTGGREFLAGTLDEVLSGKVQVPTDRPTVFSPFGLGVLDLAVARFVYDELAREDRLQPMPGFFHELSRHS